MEEQLIIAGFGGQGVLLMGQLLAQCGMMEGREVSWMPAYGAEMRGGSANCSVVISDLPIGSPKVERADAVLAMNRVSMELFEGNVAPGGMLFINSSLIKIQSARSDVRVVSVPATTIAQELGNPRVANMAMLGAYIKATGMFSPEALVEALRVKLGPAREKLIPTNREAIMAGMERSTQA